jgi:hypothetical protein
MTPAAAIRTTSIPTHLMPLALPDVDRRRINSPISTHLLPRGLLGWFPFIWSRALFPGTSSPGSPVRLVSLLLVLILPALLLYPCLNFHLLEPDEGRYAQIPREMLARGDWVVPHLQGQPYLDKPPLLYWLVMLSYSIFGVSEGAARMVPALAVHGTVLAIYLIGRRSVGERPAAFGALLLAVAPGFTSMGRLLILDGLLAFCTTLAILSTFEAIRADRLKWRWWLLGAAAAGLGVLTKGPVVLVLLAPPLWLFRWLHGANCRLGMKPTLALGATVWAINLPWYVAMGFRVPSFFRVFLWEHNAVRFVQGFDHIRPVWFYLPVVIAGLFPATLLTYGFIRFLFSGDGERFRLRTPEFGYYLLAGGWCVLFFSMSSSKLPTYILPAFPLLCLAFGVYAANRVPRVTAALIAVAFVGLGLLHYIGIPWYARVRSPMGEPENVVKYCGDPNQPIIGFPRSCDSVAFYLGRNDIRAARSKNSSELIQMLQQNPRTVVLFTHRHSLEAMRYVLPGDLRIVETVTFQRENEVGNWFDVLSTETPWGLCDLAVVERR